MAISEEFLALLRDRTDIEELLSSYIVLKRRGKNLVGLCPFHSEKTPSFTVYPENGSFYCFGCGAGGDAITFVRRMENLDYVEAVKFLAQRAGLRMPEDGYDDTLSKRRQRILSANREAARFFHGQLLLPENAFALDYFARDRALSMDTIRHFGLGFAPNRWDALLRYLQQKGFSAAELVEANLVRQGKNGGHYDNFRNRVVIPIIDVRGNVIAFGARVLDDTKPKYVNTSDTLVYKKSNALFALNYAKNNADHRVIFCEGYMDVIALNQAGFTNAVAGCGTALTEQQARLLSRYADEVLLCYDADGAGREAMRKAIRIFSGIGMKIKVIRLNGGKDADEILRKYGRDRFQALLDGASNDIEYRLLTEREQFDLQTDDGKVQYLKRAVEILAVLQNRVEADVYMSRLSEEYGVDKAALAAQVQQAQLSLRRRQKREQMEDLTKSLVPGRDAVNPEMREHYRAGKAEEAILTLLLHNNEWIDRVRRLLSPQDFVTSFHRHVYEQILRCYDASQCADVPHLSAYFDPQEIGRVTRISMLHTLYQNSYEECMDCIRTLQNEREAEAHPPAAEDNESFLAQLQKLREQKS